MQLWQEFQRNQPAGCMTMKCPRKLGKSSLIPRLRVCLPAGSVGNPMDRAQCIWNDGCKVFSTQVKRIRAHAAGIIGYGVEACKGPVQKGDETDAQFRKHEGQFQAAKQRCGDKLRAKSDKKKRDREEDALAESTAGYGDIAGPAPKKPEVHVQYPCPGAAFA